MSFLTDEQVIRLAEQYHTALYVFDDATLRRSCENLRSGFSDPNYRIRYACKALTLQPVLKIVRDEGLWIDASSINEVHRALRAGFKPEEIYYPGEAETADVYRFLVENGILINGTSIAQIRLLGRVAPNHHCSIRIN